MPTLLCNTIRRLPNLLQAWQPWRRLDLQINHNTEGLSTPTSLHPRWWWIGQRVMDSHLILVSKRELIRLREISESETYSSDSRFSSKSSKARICKETLLSSNSMTSAHCPRKSLRELDQSTSWISWLESWIMQITSYSWQDQWPS